MKAIKIYLAIVTVLLVVGISFGVYVWYTVQQINTEAGGAGVVTEKSAETSQGANAETPIEPMTITTSELTPTQQKMLATFGFEGDTFTVTEAMIVCARNAVGETRLGEILDGAAPSPLESVKLLPCFKS